MKSSAELFSVDWPAQQEGPERVVDIPSALCRFVVWAKVPAEFVGQSLLNFVAFLLTWLFVRAERG